MRAWEEGKKPQENEDEKWAMDVILVEQHVNFDRTFLK